MHILSDVCNNSGGDSEDALSQRVGIILDGGDAADDEIQIPIIAERGRKRGRPQRSELGPSKMVAILAEKGGDMERVFMLPQGQAVLGPRLTAAQAKVQNYMEPFDPPAGSVVVVGFLLSHLAAQSSERKYDGKSFPPRDTEN